MRINESITYKDNEIILVSTSGFTSLWGNVVKNRTHSSLPPTLQSVNREKVISPLLYSLLVLY